MYIVIKYIISLKKHNIEDLDSYLKLQIIQENLSHDKGGKYLNKMKKLDIDIINPRDIQNYNIGY